MPLTAEVVCVLFFGVQATNHPLLQFERESGMFASNRFNDIVCLALFFGSVASSGLAQNHGLDEDAVEPPIEQSQRALDLQKLQDLVDAAENLHFEKLDFAAARAKYEEAAPLMHKLFGNSNWQSHVLEVERMAAEQDLMHAHFDLGIVKAAYDANRTAKTLIETGNLDRAEAVLMRAILSSGARIGPTHVLYYSLRRQLAQVLFRLGRVDDACTTYQSLLLQLESAAPEWDVCIAHIELDLAGALFAKDEMKQAQGYFASAAEFFEPYPEYQPLELYKCRMKLCRLSLAMGDGRRAARELDSCVRLRQKYHTGDFDDSLRQMSMLATVSSFADDYNVGWRACDEVDARCRTQASMSAKTLARDVAVQRGEMFFALEDYDEARRRLENVLQDLPNSDKVDDRIFRLPPVAILAAVHMKRQDAHELGIATGQLERACTDVPLAASLPLFQHYFRSAQAFLQGDLDRAKTACRKAMDGHMQCYGRESSRYRDDLLLFSDILLAQHRIEEALSAAQEARGISEELFGTDGVRLLPALRCQAACLRLANRRDKLTQVETEIQRLEARKLELRAALEKVIAAQQMDASPGVTEQR